jgi:hypothetical protein
MRASRWEPIVVGVLMLLVGGCADSILLRARVDPQTCVPAKPRTVGDRNVEVFVDRTAACKDTPQAYVLGFTGNNGRAEEMVGWMTSERWADFPVEIWMVNYPGFGKSTGPAKLDAIVPAALEVYDALRKVAGDRPIYIDGNSFGAAVALHVATVRPVEGLVLKNPPALRQVILQRYGWWNLYLLAGPVASQVPAELDAPAMAAKVSVPAVFLMAEGDTLVPPRFQAYVHDAYAGPKMIVRMPNHDHIDRADPATEAIVRGWIGQHWRRPAAVTAMRTLNAER